MACFESHEFVLLFFSVIFTFDFDRRRDQNADAMLASTDMSSELVPGPDRCHAFGIWSLQIYQKLVVGTVVMEPRYCSQILLICIAFKDCCNTSFKLLSDFFYTLLLCFPFMLTSCKHCHGLPSFLFSS